MWYTVGIYRLLRFGSVIDTSYIYKTAVAYSDLGPDGLLDHRGLARMLQEAASIASDDCGYGLVGGERATVHWLLASWRLELLERPVWRSEIAVETWPRSLDGFRSDRDFLVRSGGKLAARGSSRWYLVSRSTGRLTRITPEIRSAYPLEERSVFETPLRKDGKSVPEAREAFVSVAGRRDMDTNRHVNNIHYLEYALEALPEEVSAALPKTVEIVFRRQILQGTTFRCLYSQSASGEHQVEITSGEGADAVHHAFVWFY